MSPLSLNARLISDPHPSSGSLDEGLYFPEIKKAGFVVFRENKNRIEFLLVQRPKHDDWSFPKGHVDHDELPLETAFRETFEEAGIRPMMLGQLPDLLYFDNKKRRIRLSFYLGWTDGSDQGIYPTQQATDEKPRWIQLSEVENMLSHNNLRDYFAIQIKPLFNSPIRRQTTTQIIYSVSEQYRNGAVAMKKTLERQLPRINVIELEKLKNRVKENKSPKISYFLSNHPDVRTAAFWLKANGNHVINDRNLEYWLTKSMAQEIMRRAKLPVLASSPFITKAMPPKLIQKGEMHNTAFNKHLLNNDPWKFYTERKVAGTVFSEHKIANIAGRIWADDESIVSNELIGMVHRIQECLGLEIFSADVFVHRKTGQIFFFDINPAPAFFTNAKARNALGDYLLQLTRFIS